MAKKNEEKEKENIMKSLEELKKLKKELTEKSEELKKELSEDFKKINWKKLNHPATYALAGFVGGLIVGALISKNKNKKE
ncbi:MAG: hypothetical protein QXR30_04685 [Candidatus Woesearchaeota archaeon]